MQSYTFFLLFTHFTPLFYRINLKTFFLIAAADGTLDYYFALSAAADGPSESFFSSSEQSDRVSERFFALSEQSDGL